LGPEQVRRSIVFLVDDQASLAEWRPWPSALPRSAGKNYRKQQPIASLEALLDPSRFVRLHRAVIVNLERVARSEPYGKESRLAILFDGARRPVGRAGYARLLEAMGDSQGNRSTTR